MDIEIRPITYEERPAWVHAAETAFSSVAKEDEVEAALDDTNLQRLLGMLTELRETSQLIVITHQKRTMEIADALYGVSMRGDGVTSVISSRLREAVSA